MSEKRHGAIYQTDGSTCFTLWAPNAAKVSVKFDDNHIETLSPQEGGWFSATIKCPAGTGYQFVIDDDLIVPDPAARAQLGDVDGPSCVVDPSYHWQAASWQGRPWHECIIYELHVGLFGGFTKIKECLPSLLELGVNAIELMPINEFPGARNWGYDGVLIFAPESTYGTPAELKELIDTAHSLGMMIFLDVVYNHFGPHGNYIGQYARDFFRDDIKTPWGSAIDFRRREVRDFFCQNALMWIDEYRVDGLRLDAVHAISEKDFLEELATRVRKVTTGRHVHLILENEDNNASLLTRGFDAQWNDDGHNVLHHLLTDEREGYYRDFCESATEKLARCLAEGFIYQGERTPRGRDRGEPSNHLPPTAFVLFLQNHDQIGNRAFGDRLSVLVNKQALKAATALLLLTPMIPLIFMGEERGATQPFLYFTDYHDELAAAVREGRRQEFAHFPQYQARSNGQDIPDPNAHSTFIASVFDPGKHDQPEHQDWWEYYCQLIKLRRAEIIPRLEGAVSTGAQVLADRSVVASWRLGDGTHLRIFINLSSTALLSVTFPPDPILFCHHVSQADRRQGILPGHSIIVTLGG